MRSQNKWWAEHGARTVPLALRSVFTAFTAWNLTEYERIIWLETDQIVLRPLEPLWRTPLGNDTDAAAANKASAVMREAVRPSTTRALC